MRALFRPLFWGLLLAGGWPAAPATPAQWAEEIDRLTAADAARPAVQDAVVFIGSSSIRLWSSLAADFPGVAVINHGFGGSELPDSTFYAERLVIPYHPRLVVLYAGDNDLWNGKSPATLAADFQAFRRKIHDALPAARIIFLSIKLSPSRARIYGEVRAANALVAADCATDPRCRFVDVATALLDAEGRPRPELFRDDQLHLQPAGYALWARVLAPCLSP